MKKSIRLFALGLYFSIPSISAQQAQTNWELSSAESGTKSYVARDYISLKPGFSYKAVGANTFTAKIDEYLLFPPNDATYGKPGGTPGSTTASGGVVGAIPGQFVVSPSGAATYSIPIEVPAGINGLQPELSLVYNSQGGFGLAGLNFDITGISEITRVPQNLYYDGKLSAVSFNEQDQFAKDGRRLVLISGKHGESSATYGFEIEDHTRIHGMLGNNKIWFQELSKKNGLYLAYGSTDNSCVILPDNKGVYAWKLRRVSDTNGNEINYEYEEYKDGLTRIKHIYYAKNCRIDFEYYTLQELNLTSLMPVVLAGNKVSPGNFVKSIAISSNNSLYRRYDFKYLTEYPRLTSVELFNGDGEQMPPISFEWDDYFLTGQKNLSTVSGTSVAIGDFQGTGKSLMAVYDEENYRLSVRKYSNDNWVQLNYRDFPESKFGKGSIEIFNIGDVDSDGNDDLFINQVYYLNSPLIPRNRVQILKGNALSTIASDGGIAWLDPVSGNFYGDGRLSVLFFAKVNSGYSIKSFYNGVINTLGLNDGFKISEAEKIYSGDFNGDGKSDILIKTSKDLRFYTLQEGELIFKKSISKSGIKHLVVADFNGDGIDDLLLAEPERKFYYLKDFGETCFTEGFSNFGNVELGNSGSKITDELRKTFGYNAVTKKGKFEVLGAFGTGFGENCADFEVFSYGHYEIVLTYTGEIPPIPNYYGFPHNINFEKWNQEEFKKYVNYWRQGNKDLLESEGGVVWGEPEVVPGFPQDGLQYVIKAYCVNAVLTSFTRRYTGGWGKANTYFLSPKSIENIKDIVSADFPGNGSKSTFLRYSDKLAYVDTPKPQRKVSKITQGFSDPITLDYTRLIHGNGTYAKNSGEKYPLLDYAGEAIVVKTITQGTDRKLDFKYRDGKFHKEGLGFLGFGKMIITDKLSVTETEKTNELSLFPPVFLESDISVYNSKNGETDKEGNRVIEKIKETST